MQARGRMALTRRFMGCATTVELQDLLGIGNLVDKPLAEPLDAQRGEVRVLHLRRMQGRTRGVSAPCDPLNAYSDCDVRALQPPCFTTVLPP